MEPMLEDDGVLREWAPLSVLLRQIPLRGRRGFFPEDIMFTCLDATAECIAVGTNTGVLYFYNRATENMQCLRPERTSLPITSVKVVSSVDFMVACGDKAGVVSVFKLLKPTPDWLPLDSYRPSSNRSIERYTIGGLHSSPVTTLEWSLNGQTLFSGDSSGLVVFTEIDFYMSLSKASEVVNERYCIVQLSFCQRLQLLLVATEYRAILCAKQHAWRVVQIGQKERRSLGPLGATLCPRPLHPLEPVVYSARTGLRLWQADINGNVQKTIIFKEALTHGKVRLLTGVQGTPAGGEGPGERVDFGLLLVWHDGLLVTYSEKALLVLDPEKGAVVANLAHLPGLRAVVTTPQEIFLVDGTRNLRRLAYTADRMQSNGLSEAPPVASLFDLTTRLKHITLPFQTNQEAVSGLAGEVVSADEVTELPPIQELGGNIEELVVEGLTSPKYYTLEQIGTQDFDDIIYNSKVSSSVKHKIVRQEESESSSQSEVMANCDSASEASSSVSVESDRSRRPSRLEMPIVIPHDIQPDLRSPDSIERDVQDKERLVARALNLEEVLLHPRTQGSHPKDLQATEYCPELHELVSESIKPPLSLSDSICSLSPLERAQHQSSYAVTEREEQLLLSTIIESPTKLLTQSESTDSVLNLSSEARPDNYSEFTEIDLEPSDTSKTMETVLNSESYGGVNLLLAGSNSETVNNYNPSSPMLDLQLQSSHFGEHMINKFEGEKNRLPHGTLPASAKTPVYYKGWSEDWREYTCPEVISWVAISSEFICIGGSKLSLYYARLNTLGLHWTKLDYKSTYLALSPSGRLVWKLDFGIAHALADTTTSGPFGSIWQVASRGVEAVSLGDAEAWYISAGEVFIQTNLSRSKPTSEPELVPCPVLAQNIAYSNYLVWLMSVELEVLWREGITAQCPQGTHWLHVIIPSALQVANIALGPKHIGWIVTSTNDIYFSDNHKHDQPDWWQVSPTRYIYTSSSLSERLGMGLDQLPWQQEKVVQIAPSDTAVSITGRIDASIHVNTVAVRGHKWSAVELMGLPPCLTWRHMTAEGVFEDKGSLWLLSRPGELYQVMSDSLIPTAVSLPCRGSNIVCLAATLHALWLLTQCGDIYVRQGLSDACPKGTKWRQLNLEQIKKCVELRHLSCGSDVVWATDSRGDVYMLVGSPHSIATDTFSPAWVPVEHKPHANTAFTKVFVGPETYMVWALDTKNNVYVREAIFPDFHVGTGWVLVPGVNASHLSVSATSVWALSSDGSVYRRYGISQTNYIGDYWMKIPAHLAGLTVSISEGVWGVSQSTSGLVVYTQRVIALSEEAQQKMSATTVTGAKDDGWELI